MVDCNRKAVHSARGAGERAKGFPLLKAPVCPGFSSLNDTVTAQSHMLF